MLNNNKIEELNRDDYSKIASIVSTVDNMPEVMSIIWGNNPGCIYVDNVVSPKSALVWSKGIEGFYLVGDSQNSVFLNNLDVYVKKFIAPQLRKQGIQWFEVSCDPVEWDDVIFNVFPSRTIIRSLQYVYGITSINDIEYKSDFTETEIVQRIDQNLLSHSRYRNHSFITSKLDHYWSDEKSFLSNGIGYVVIKDLHIVSICFSAFVAGRIHVADVETVALTRRKGCARLAVAAFLNECYKRDYKPYWDCMGDNIASQKLAEGLGFEKVREYTLFSVLL